MCGFMLEPTLLSLSFFPVPLSLLFTPSLLLSLSLPPFLSFSPSLSQGITPAMVILKEGLLNGSPAEKEEAARVLVEVIHLSSPKTLSSGRTVMLIAGPLIRVLGDRFAWSVRVATLEALVELVRKVM